MISVRGKLLTMKCYQFPVNLPNPSYLLRQLVPYEKPPFPFTLILPIFPKRDKLLFHAAEKVSSSDRHTHSCSSSCLFLLWSVGGIVPLGQALCDGADHLLPNCAFAKWRLNSQDLKSQLQDCRRLHEDRVDVHCQIVVCSRHPAQAENAPPAGP